MANIISDETIEYAGVGHDKIHTDQIQQAIMDQLRRHDFEHLFRRSLQAGSGKRHDECDGRRLTTLHAARLIRPAQGLQFVR